MAARYWGFIKPFKKKRRVEPWPPKEFPRRADYLLQYKGPLLRDVLPGTMWLTHPELFGKHPASGEDLKNHLNTPQALFVHPRFIEDERGGAPILDHIHLSLDKKLASTHDDGFVLGKEKDYRGRKVVEMYPLVKNTHNLNVDTRTHVLIEGERSALIDSLYALAPEHEPKPEIGVFKRIFNRIRKPRA